MLLFLYDPDKVNLELLNFLVSLTKEEFPNEKFLYIPETTKLILADLEWLKKFKQDFDDFYNSIIAEENSPED